MDSAACNLLGLGRLGSVVLIFPQSEQAWS
jgi:hypothetical protein